MLVQLQVFRVQELGRARGGLDARLFDGRHLKGDGETGDEAKIRRSGGSFGRCDQHEAAVQFYDGGSGGCDDSVHNGAGGGLSTGEGDQAGDRALDSGGVWPLFG